MSTGKYNTFWKIIKENKIEIPTIQRDYAYGRKSAISIRQKLIADIENSIREQTPINLDFVYGKLFGKENQASIERNRSNIQSLLKTIKSYASDLHMEISDVVTILNADSQSNVSFIPLDGQQRLTTLYLVHWYVAQRNRDRESLNILKRFSYSTRLSSKDFCLMLCDYNFDFISSSIPASEVICNNEAYFSFWEKDPTVKSMLVVIDEIHKVFNSEKPNYSECWSQLTNSDTITFDFFDLEDFELTDELYIKMNARGKHLTNFENFKAWLIKNSGDSILIEDWKRKFDIQWNDLFWRAKEKTKHNIDSEYLQFFKILFLGDFMKSQNSNVSGMNDDSALENYETDILNIDDFKSVIGVLRKKDSNPNEIFKSGKLFKSKINDYLQLLDLLRFDIDTNTYFIVNKYLSTDLSKLFFGEKLNNLTWWDTTLHYAVSRYLLKVRGNNIYFNQWVRIISNLIYNTRIDTPKLFIDAIQSIDSLIGKLDNRQSVYNNLSDFHDEDISFFSLSQKKEEIFKSKLFLSDPDWESVLIASENHNYFYGQVGFILNSFNGLPFTIEQFNEKYNKISVLFSEEVLNENTNLVSRCFLSLGDCFYAEGDNRIFNSNLRGTLRNRTENWRKFFENKMDYIEKVISHPKYNETNIITSLNDIILDELPKVKHQYFGMFVENPRLFEYAKKHVIRKYESNYYILSSTRISGYYVELYTYDWYLNQLEKFSQEFPDLDLKYIDAKGQEDEPSMKFTISGIESCLLRNCKNGKFELNNESSSIEFETIEDAISHIIESYHAIANQRTSS